MQSREGDTERTTQIREGAGREERGEELAKRRTWRKEGRQNNTEKKGGHGEEWEHCREERGREPHGEERGENNIEKSGNDVEKKRENHIEKRGERTT